MSHKIDSFTRLLSLIELSHQPFKMITGVSLDIIVQPKVKCVPHVGGNRDNPEVGIGMLDRVGPDDFHLFRSANPPLPRVGYDLVEPLSTVTEVRRRNRIGR